MREVILYDNAVTITYNFIDYDVPTKVTTEYVENIEQQIESADAPAVSFISSSYNQADFSPRSPDLIKSGFFFPAEVGYFISARFACRTRDTRLTFHYANKFARSTITAVANRAAYEPR